jgi:hypothetical protein
LVDLLEFDGRVGQDGELLVVGDVVDDGDLVVQEQVAYLLRAELLIAYCDLVFHPSDAALCHEANREMCLDPVGVPVVNGPDLDVIFCNPESFLHLPEGLVVVEDILMSLISAPWVNTPCKPSHLAASSIFFSSME